MSRDVGRMGENLLRQWASQQGLIFNSSDDQDATGWDFLLEWPTNSNRGLTRAPLDRAPAPLQCLIQVKSTDQELKRWSVKLSNWERLVRSPLPTFFLVLKFGGSNECKEAFLVNVGEENIRSTLKRLRELSRENPVTKTNKSTRSLTWSENDAFSPLSGQGLEAAIRDRVGMPLEEYVRWKGTAVERVGYENAANELKVQVRPPSNWSGNPQDLLVDFALGLTPHLELESGEITDVRFGIPSREPDQVFVAGTRLELVDRPSAGKGEILFRAPGIYREIRIVADTLLPHGVARVVDESRLRARFTAPFIDFVFGFAEHQTIDFQLHLPDLKEEHSLTDLRPSAAFILLMEVAHTAQEQLEVEMFFEGRRISTGKLIRGGVPAQPLVEWAALIERAWITARHFEIEQETRVTVADLAKFRDQLLLLHSILSSDPAYIRVTFWLDHEPDKTHPSWCFPLAAECILGNKVVQVAAAAIGVIHPTGGIDGTRREFHFETTDVRRHYQHLYRSEKSERSTWEELIQMVVEKYDPTMNVLVLRDD
jgi:hypothetical protein